MREVGTELEEERAEIAVQAGEVIVVHQGGGLHDPGIAAARLGVSPFLGAKDGCLLLGLADKNDALGRLKVLEMIGHHLVLALTLVKLHDGDRSGFDEPFHRS